MRGLEVSEILFDSVMMPNTLVVVAEERKTGFTHLFRVTADGVHCKMHLVEHGNVEIARYGFGEIDTVSGLWSMRAYRKVQADVIAYVQEQKEMAAH